MSLTYILSLLIEVSSSELASTILLQNFLIKSSLFSVTTNIKDSRLFITPSRSLKIKIIINIINYSFRIFHLTSRVVQTFVFSIQLHKGFLLLSKFSNQ